MEKSVKVNNTIDAHALHGGNHILVSIKTGQITQAQAILDREQVRVLIQALQRMQEDKKA